MLLLIKCLLYFKYKVIIVELKVSRKKVVYKVFMMGSKLEFLGSLGKHLYCVICIFFCY